MTLLPHTDDEITIGALAADCLRELAERCDPDTGLSLLELADSIEPLDEGDDDVVRDQ